MVTTKKQNATTKPALVTSNAPVVPAAAAPAPVVPPKARYAPASTIADQASGLTIVSTHNPKRPGSVSHTRWAAVGAAFGSGQYPGTIAGYVAAHKAAAASTPGGGTWPTATADLLWGLQRGFYAVTAPTGSGS